MVKNLNNFTIKVKEVSHI